MNGPDLSVVVTIVDGGKTLECCLEALAAQRGAPALEVIVPYDATVQGIEEMIARFPAWCFLDLGEIETERNPRSESGRHELYDRRRSAGLDAARGRFVAMLEDRGVPRSDWAQEALHAHVQRRSAVGGAVVNGVDRLRNWAVYFCDFGRYQPLLEAGPTSCLTDINVCYRREALAEIRELWRERYHEPTVHEALQRRGGTLHLAPHMIVEQRRRDLRLGALVAERFHWGRVYASMRGHKAHGGLRLVLALLSPALPILLLLRLARQQLQRPTWWIFVRAVPLILLLLISWSLGELAGYLTGR